MSLTHPPEPWRPNAIYKSSDRVTVRDEPNIYVLRCEKGGRSGLRLPKLPEAVAVVRDATAIVKIIDAECEWWIERVVRLSASRRRSGQS
jgi:hypothetical protein